MKTIENIFKPIYFSSSLANKLIVLCQLPIDHIDEIYMSSVEN